MSIQARPAPHNPALIEHAEQRAQSAQNRIADVITAFAGSMAFVYIHIVWFGAWIGFGVEKYPFGLLTMIVSLEAIFLSTFVMIGQNRQSTFQQAKADHDYREEEVLLKENTDLTRLIHQLTEELHTRLVGAPSSSAPSSSAPSSSAPSSTTPPNPD